MIFLVAKIKCDRAGCEAETDVKLELHIGAEYIPDIILKEWPEGWGRGWANFDGIREEPHLCPEHAPKV